MRRNWSLHDVTEFIFNLLEMVLQRKWCASLVCCCCQFFEISLYIKKQCYFKVTRAPVSSTLDIKTLKTVTFECQLKSTFEFMANFVTQLRASACVPPLFVCKHDLVAAVDTQGGTCFYRLSVAITVCFTAPQDIVEFSVYRRKTMFLQCLSSEFHVIATNVAAYSDVSRVTGLSHISSLLKDSVTNSERMKTVYFARRSLDSCCVSLITLLLLPPC